MKFAWGGLGIVVAAALSPVGAATADAACGGTYVSDAVGDANVVNGVGSLLPPVREVWVPVGPNDAQSDLTGVCFGIADGVLRVRFYVASDERPSDVGRTFTAAFWNHSDCYDLSVTYSRGVDSDTASVTGTLPDGCEPPPWEALLPFGWTAEGPTATHVGAGQFEASIPVEAINARVIEYLGYSSPQSIVFNDAASALDLPFPVLVDRIPAE